MQLFGIPEGRRRVASGSRAGRGRVAAVPGILTKSFEFSLGGSKITGTVAATGAEEEQEEEETVTV